jgi:hypothetical protein
MSEHRALCGWLMKQDAQALWKGYVFYPMSLLCLMLLFWYENEK